MEQRKRLKDQIRTLKSEDFEGVALQLFRYQAAHNPLYSRFLQLLGRSPESVRTLEDIPYLPIQLFKNQLIKTGRWDEKMTFSSSGTGGPTSLHAVRDPDWYLSQADRAFATFYGPVEQYCFLGLLPSYLERTGSSLIYMVQHFIESSSHSESGFFLDDLESLLQRVKVVQQQGIPTILIGVSFALLDLAEQWSPNLDGIIVMETGGMKGRRRELTRSELHRRLRAGLAVDVIHSEYGMTELFSQAYSQGDGIFECPPTMRVAAREITDPLAQVRPGKTGVLNIIDLANIDTISFLATEDLGRVDEEGRFEVLGRLDHADIRGCNLMVADVRQ